MSTETESQTAGAKTQETANQHALRIWHIPQVGTEIEPFLIPVPDLPTAMLISETLAQYDFYQHKNRIKPNYFNATGLEVCTNGNWYEWEGENGESLSEYMGNQEKHRSAREQILWESIR